jgi:hypothetical protein
MDENVSLADLLGFDQNVAEPLRARVRKLAERWPIPAGKLRASAVEQVVDRVRERLSPRLYRVLAAAWRHHPACQEFCDSAKYPPSEVNTVELAQHNVEWGCEPAVEIIADGLQAAGMGRLAQLEFRVQVVAAMRCGVVTIQDGRFIKMDAAEMTLSAELTVETHPVIDLRVPVKLPGTIRFGEHGEPICLPDVQEPQPAAQIAVPAIANAAV